MRTPRLSGFIALACIFPAMFDLPFIDFWLDTETANDLGAAGGRTRDVHAAVNHLGAMPHDLQPNPFMFRECCRKVPPVVGDDQGGPLALAAEVDDDVLWSAVADGIRHRFLCDTVQMDGRRGVMHQDGLVAAEYAGNLKQTLGRHRQRLEG